MIKKKSKDSAGTNLLKNIATDTLVKMLQEKTLSRTETKEIKREIYRRKTLGEKVEVRTTGTNQPLFEKSGGEIKENLKGWISYHINGFSGQAIGLSVGDEKIPVFLVIEYKLLPNKSLVGILFEGISTRSFKEKFSNRCLSAGSPCVRMEADYLIRKIKYVTREIPSSLQEWIGNKQKALSIIDQLDTLSSGSKKDQRLPEIEVTKEIKEHMSKNSSYLCELKVFKYWHPSEGELREILEKLNMIFGGRLITDEGTKKNAAELVLLREVDSYFTEEKRKILVDSLMENSIIASIANETVFARECRALAEQLMDFSIPSRSIGFLVRCIEKEFYMEKEAIAPQSWKQEGNIITPWYTGLKNAYNNGFNNPDDLEVATDTKNNGSKIIIP